MNARICAPFNTAPAPAHELCFASLYHPGRGVVVPCDEFGKVDLDGLSERMRNVYLGARALVGREYLYPKLQLAH